MKQTILVLALILGSLVIVPQVSAHSDGGHDDDHHDVGHSFKNFWDDKKHKFDDFMHKHDKKHHDDDDDKDEHGGRPGTDDSDPGDPGEHCDGDNDEDDVGCDVSAPEFGGLTGPITFAITGAGLVIAKKRLLI